MLVELGPDFDEFFRSGLDGAGVMAEGEVRDAEAQCKNCAVRRKSADNWWRHSAQLHPQLRLDSG